LSGHPDIGESLSAYLQACLNDNTGFFSCQEKPARKTEPARDIPWDKGDIKGGKAVHKIKLKPIDYIIGVLFLCTAIFSLVYAIRHKDGSPRLIVTAGRTEWVYPLNVDRTIEVEGALGISRIAIENGFVRFLDSPCSNRICVQSPPLWREGDWSACLPNQVFLRIEGAPSYKDEFDAIGF